MRARPDRRGSPAALLILPVLLSLGGCFGDGSDGGPSGEVKVDGSSTVYPIAEAVVEEFARTQPGIHVVVGKSGSGGGFKRFVRGETAVSNASRPIKQDEVEQARKNGVDFIELVIAFDGITFVVNPQNDWCEELSVEDLRRIFLDPSSVNTWKDINDAWPAEELNLYIPGTDSGTFDYFREVVIGDGAIRGDVTPSEEDNVLVQGVIGDTGGLAFFGCAYYFENRSKLKALRIEGVEPTHDTIESGKYKPFSRPLFVYANKAKLERPEVRMYLEFMLDKCSELAEEVGYVKLPDEILGRSRQVLEKQRTGTCFLNEDGSHKTGPVKEIYH